MSLSFYYVVTYNLQHPTVKNYLSDFLGSCESAMEFKVRSKLYHDFVEATDAAHDDFDMKCDGLYPDRPEQALQWVTAINPIFSQDVNTEEEPVFVTGDWQDNCAGSIFFMEVDEDDEDEEEEPVFEPGSWLLKYEIFFAQDILEVPVNGEAAFSPTLAGCTTSSYH